MKARLKLGLLTSKRSDFRVVNKISIIDQMIYWHFLSIPSQLNDLGIFGQWFDEKKQ